MRRANIALSAFFALWFAVMAATDVVSMSARANEQQNQISLGLYTGDGYGGKYQIDQIEKRLDNQFSILHVYTGFNESFATFKQAKLAPVDRPGTIPLISWAPGVKQGVLYSQIASGSEDAYLRAWAQGIRDWKKPVLIRFAYEMNMTNMAWHGADANGGPASFIAAWRHIHDVFAEEGASNVRWVWCPHADQNSPYYTDMMSYYPGNAYVDWVGLDGYHWGSWPGQELGSFDRIFKASYDQLKPIDKPMMIAEIGTAADSRDPGTWIRFAFNKIAQDYPKIKAVVYFNADFSKKGEKDWRFSEHRDTMAAFREVAHNPVFSGRVN